MGFPKRILLGICGGIAAYKTAELVRLLRTQGADVQVVLTRNAKHFVTTTTLQALSGRVVRDDLWDPQAEAAMGHIELAKWADMIVIAPASANTLARLAQGFADDLLTTLCLASQAPLFVVPAMNQAMWRHPATVQNKEILQSRGVSILGPDDGVQACGDIGPGRMLAPTDIMKQLNLSQQRVNTWQGKTVLITAGPTEEPIDPVRCIKNRSSGKMGYALAQQLVNQGAKVILISGPTALQPPKNLSFHKVQTAEQMCQKVMSEIANVDVFFSVAAVADYTPVTVFKQKKKKSHDDLILTLKPTVDIVKTVCQQTQRPYVVAFAAETQNIIENGMAKWQRKGCDMLVVNDVSADKVFGKDHIAASVLTASGKIQFDSMLKVDFSLSLLKLVYESSGLLATTNT